jgi:hypothetical protein
MTASNIKSEFNKINIPLKYAKHRLSALVLTVLIRYIQILGCYDGKNFGLLSSGLQHCVILLVVTNVSDECSDSIFSDYITTSTFMTDDIIYTVDGGISYTETLVITYLAA